MNVPSKIGNIINVLLSIFRTLFREFICKRYFVYLVINSYIFNIFRIFNYFVHEYVLFHLKLNFKLCYIMSILKALVHIIFVLSYKYVGRITKMYEFNILLTYQDYFT